jgi:aspartate kinase
MKIVVKKFGGTSVSTTERIEFLAEKLVKERSVDEQVVIVVSAMGDTTDNLFSLAYQICDKPYQRELDMLATAGERISMSLLSIALHKYGATAISFTGSQSGIITDNNHGNAGIINVSAFRIREELAKGKFVIVAGYQGVSLEKEVTTLGRGGSDTTAVALAGYLNAERCEIYTDVDGVYTADPNSVSDAQKIDTISYGNLLYLAKSGCKVVHPRAVEFALKYNVELEIKSSFNNSKGTVVKREISMEEKEIRAITGRKRLTAVDIKLNKDGVEERVTAALSGNNPEICDYSIVESGLFRIVVEEKDTDVLIKQLEEHQIDDYQVYKGLSSITLAGLKVSSDLNLLGEILVYFREKRRQIFWLTKTQLGFTVYLIGESDKGEIDDLHRLFVNN